MNLADQQIDQLMAALPECIDVQRHGKVKLILGEWAKVDVEEYRQRPTPAQLRARSIQLKKAASYADKLVAAINKLDPAARRWIVLRPLSGVTPRSHSEAKQIIARKVEDIRRLGVAADGAHNTKYVRSKTF